MGGELEQLQDEEAALRGRGDYDGALRVLDRMLAIDPEFSPALNNKGALLTVGHRYLEAIPLLEAALVAEPANAVAHNNLGMCLHHTGRHEEALEHLDAAWRGGYRNDGVRYNAGRVNLALGRVREGLALMADSLAGSPDPAETMAFLQTVARAVGVVDRDDVSRFADELVAAAERIEETDVIRARPPLGMFYLRITVDGFQYGIRFD